MAKILVVDDEQDIVQVIKARLEKVGHEVLTAYNGKDGYEIACRENPDLLILDLMMPKMDGFTVCQSIKSDDKYKNIPVIILTARGKGLDLERIMASECGADAYINKPFETQVLISKIEELLKR